MKDFDFNVRAQRISELCDLTQAKTEPPLVMDMTDSELKSLLYRPLQLDGLPCHTQACERRVKVTSESSKISADPDERDGCSYNKIAARQRNKDTRKKVWIA